MLRWYKELELFKGVSNTYAYNAAVLSFLSPRLLHCNLIWSAVIQEAEAHGK